MKNRFRLISRGSRGGALYCVDGSTGKRTSLGECTRDEAEQIVLAKNQALRQPALNLQIARAYAATPREIAIHMKTQHGGKGHMALLEDYQRDHPKSQYADKIPASWIFGKPRIEALIRAQTLIRSR